MRQLILIALLILTAACSSVPTDSTGWIKPEDAIRVANEDPKYGLRGDFVLTVKAIGEEGGWVFLNSEKDYRDQRNLAVKIPTSVVPKLEQRLGLDLHGLKGRRIVVLGVARRIRIDFTENGHSTGKYYYQTHVRVDSATQVNLAR